MGIEDKHVHRVQPAESLYCSTSRVPACRTNNGNALIALFEGDLKHLTDELHREIFEGKRRTVKKFQKKMVIFKLDQRGPRRMAKIFIGRRYDVEKHFVVKSVADKGTYHTKRNFFVAESSQDLYFVSRHLRNVLGDIKSAIAGQTCQHCVFETKMGRCSSGRDILHQPLPFTLCLV